jgi:hypothetical protein
MKKFKDIQVTARYSSEENFMSEIVISLTLKLQE